MSDFDELLRRYEVERRKNPRFDEALDEVLQAIRLEAGKLRSAAGRKIAQMADIAIHLNQDEGLGEGREMQQVSQQNRRNAKQPRKDHAAIRAAHRRYVRDRGDDYGAVAYVAKKLMVSRSTVYRATKDDS